MWLPWRCPFNSAEEVRTALKELQIEKEIESPRARRKRAESGEKKNMSPTTGTSAPLADPGPDQYGIDPWPSLQNALNNSAIQAKTWAANYNANLLTVYMGAWNFFENSVAAGFSSANPPVPPMAWKTEVGADGYSHAVVGATPICAMPPIPPGPKVPVVPVPGCVAVGIAIAGNPPWFTVGATDAAPAGYETVPNTKAADGTLGTFRRFASPFGGWYEKIA